MPTEVFGLPLHPLAVHLPVVLVPLLAAATAAYVLLPRTRRAVGWLALGLSVVTPLAVLGAYLSGQNIAETTLAQLDGEFADEMSASIQAHAVNGVTLLWLTIAAAPLTWIFTGYATGRLVSFTANRTLKPIPAAEAASPLRTGVLVVTGAALLGLAAAMVYFVIRAGHTGAQMVWAA